MTTKTIAQYDPSAINYGLSAIKSFGSLEEGGLGVRVEYAYNCYTTYLAEYSHLLSVGSFDEETAYNEFGLGVNLIVFNWFPTTITGGMGYIGNDSKIFKDIESQAFLSFRTGSINHGAQIKLRALHQFIEPIHVFAELNIKSLGRRYDTFLIGISYDFGAKW